MMPSSSTNLRSSFGTDRRFVMGVVGGSVLGEALGCTLDAVPVAADRNLLYANDANAFGLDGLALSTANLFSAVQPGGSLFGLQHSNPVDPSVAYGGNSSNNGTATDFMVGKKIGGVNVFGGGLGLYNASRKIIGAVGVSGDTSCADHHIA